VFVCHYKSWSTKNTFRLKKNLIWFPEKYFPFILGGKHFSESCEKFRNVILSADYIKFDPQTFDCYIYFVLNICFSISSLRNLIFILTLILIFIIIICFFLVIFN